MGTSSRSRATSTTEAAEVRAYLAAQPPAQRRLLKELRALLLDGAKGATDAFSYRIPGARLDGSMILWYAGWKEHVSLYPVTPAMLRAAGAALDEYQVSKGTLRFAMDEPLPTTLVRRLVKARVAEMREKRRGARAG